MPEGKNRRDLYVVMVTYGDARGSCADMVLGTDNFPWALEVARHVEGLGYGSPAIIEMTVTIHRLSRGVVYDRRTSNSPPSPVVFTRVKTEDGWEEVWSDDGLAAASKPGRPPRKAG